MGIASPDDNPVDVCFLTKSLLVQESFRVICKTQESISLVVTPEALGWLWWLRAGGRHRPEMVQWRPWRPKVKDMGFTDGGLGAHWPL